MAIQITPRSARYIQSNRAAASAVEPFVTTPISEERANAIRNAPAAQPADVPADYSRVHDHAFDVLSNASNMTDDQRAPAWEQYHLAKTPQDLATRLQTLNLPVDVHQQLLDAKQSTVPVLNATDNVVGAIQKLASMDPRIRQIGESHPNILRAFLSASEDRNV